MSSFSIGIYWVWFIFIAILVELTWFCVHHNVVGFVYLNSYFRMNKNGSNFLYGSLMMMMTLAVANELYVCDLC